MKKKLIFGIVLLMIILWVIYDILNHNQEENFVDVISYLQNKYKQDFEIVNEKSRQYESSGLVIDGSVFWKSRKIKDKYEYAYEILSVSDGVKFKVYQLSNQGKNYFEDSYAVLQETDVSLEEIEKYIRNTVGNSNTAFETSVHEPTDDYSLFYTSYLTFTINEDLDKIFDDAYIQTLYKMQKYIEKKSSNINSLLKKEGRMELHIFLEYLNNKTIRLGWYGPSVNEFKQGGGLLSEKDLKKINISLEDYKERLQR